MSHNKRRPTQHSAVRRDLRTPKFRMRVEEKRSKASERVSKHKLLSEYEDWLEDEDV